MSRMEEFKEFVSKHPKLKEEVTNKTYTWQNIYENWVILGENDPMWNKYKEEKEIKPNTLEDLLSQNNIKSIINYVKKLDPDSISKTLNTVQKVLQITQSIGGRPTGIYNNNYNSWWD